MKDDRKKGENLKSWMSRLSRLALLELSISAQRELYNRLKIEEHNKSKGKVTIYAD